jgi:hypothetical protein
MPTYLYGFGYEDKLEMECNDRTGSDYESSKGVFIEASSEAEALTWGCEIAELFMRHEHDGDPSISWRARGYAHWIQPHPETSSWSHCLPFLQRVRVGELPDFSRMTSRAYVEWSKANGLDA